MPGGHWERPSRAERGNEQMMKTGREPVARRRARLIGRALALGVMATTMSLITPVAEATEPAAADTPTDPSQYDSDGDGVPEEANAAEAEALARELSLPVEDLSARTESSTSVIEPDGATRYQDFGTPVRVEDETGEWHDVDYTLAQQPDGSWAPKHSPANVVINATSGDAREAARVEFADGTSVGVSFPGLPGPDGTSIGSGAETPLPEPVIDGGVATYPLEGYSGSVDLVVSMTATGVSTWLRINEELPAGELEILQTRGVTFGVQTDRGAELLTANQAAQSGALPEDMSAADGGLVLTDDSGEILGAAPEMLAWDGSATDSHGIPTDTVNLETSLDPAPPSSSSAAGVTDYNLTVTPPPGFLTQDDGTASGEGVTGDGVEYPVVIDPQFEALTRMHDTWVRNGINANNATDMKLVVGRQPGSGTDSAESFLSFNAAPIVGKTVYFSSLTLFQYDAGSCDPRTMYIHRVTRSWTEGGTNWANRPGVSPSGFHKVALNVGRAGCPDATSTTAHSEDDYLVIPIPQITQAWSEGVPNYGLRLATAGDADYTHERRFCSSNTNQAYDVCKWIAYKPALEVLYGDGDEITNTDAACVAYAQQNAPGDWTCSEGVLSTFDTDGQETVTTLPTSPAPQPEPAPAPIEDPEPTEPDPSIRAKRIDDYHANKDSTWYFGTDNRFRGNIRFTQAVALHNHSANVTMTSFATSKIHINWKLRIREDISFGTDETVFTFPDRHGCFVNIEPANRFCQGFEGRYGDGYNELPYYQAKFFYDAYSIQITVGGKPFRDLGGTSAQSERITCYKTVRCKFKK